MSYKVEYTDGTYKTLKKLDITNQKAGEQSLFSGLLV